MDFFLTCSLGIIQSFLAGLGVYVSLKPPPADKHKQLIILFIFFGALGVAASIYQQYRNKIYNDIQQENFKTNLDKQTKITESLKDDLHQSSRSQEFMKGQLTSISLIISQVSKTGSDPALKQLATAINKMGSATSLATSISNKQLCAKTSNLVSRMQQFERSRQKELRDHVYPESRAAKTDQEQSDIYMKFALQNEFEFRTTLHGEANYLKEELLRRLPPQPKVEEPWRLIAFDGKLSGPIPVADAAGYLDSLSRKLCP